MKKFFKYTSGLLGFIILNSCTTADEFVEPNNTSGRVFSILEIDDGLENTEFGEEIFGRVGNEPVFFRDISFGANKTTWIFPEGAVNIQGSNNNITSEEQEIDVSFLRSGEIEVQLVGEFSGPVQSDRQIIPITILDPIDVKFTTDPPSVGNTTIITESGDDIVFTSTSEGEPEVVNYFFKNEGIEDFTPFTNFLQQTDNIFDVRELGNYKIKVEASSVTPFGFDVDETLTIRVIEPTKNGNIRQVFEDSNNKIVVLTNRPFDSLPANANDIFVINVGGTSIPVSDVEISEIDSSRLVLSLEGDRNITFSENATLSLNSTDLTDRFGFPIESISDLKIALFEEKIGAGSIIDFDNIEEGTSFVSDGTFMFFDVNFPLSGGGEVEISNDDTRPGSVQNGNALKITQTSGVRTIANQESRDIVVPESGKYILRYWAKSNVPGTGLFFLERNSFSTFDFEPEIGQEWTMYISNPFDLTSGNLRLNLRFDNLAATSGWELFIDDVELIRADR